MYRTALKQPGGGRRTRNRSFASVGTLNWYRCDHILASLGTLQLIFMVLESDRIEAAVDGDGWRLVDKPSPFRPQPARLTTVLESGGMKGQNKQQTNTNLNVQSRVCPCVHERYQYQRPVVVMVAEFSRVPINHATLFLLLLRRGEREIEGRG